MNPTTLDKIIKKHFDKNDKLTPQRRKQAILEEAYKAVEEERQRRKFFTKGESKPAIRKSMIVRAYKQKNVLPTSTPHHLRQKPQHLNDSNFTIPLSPISVENLKEQHTPKDQVVIDLCKFDSTDLNSLDSKSVADKSNKLNASKKSSDSRKEKRSVKSKKNASKKSQVEVSSRKTRSQTHHENSKDVGNDHIKIISCDIIREGGRSNTSKKNSKLTSNIQNRNTDLDNSDSSDSDIEIERTLTTSAVIEEAAPEVKEKSINNTAKPLVSATTSPINFSNQNQSHSCPILDLHKGVESSRLRSIVGNLHNRSMGKGSPNDTRKTINREIQTSGINSCEKPVVTPICLKRTLVSNRCTQTMTEQHTQTSNSLSKVPPCSEPKLQVIQDNSECSTSNSDISSISTSEILNTQSKDVRSYRHKLFESLAQFKTQDDFDFSLDDLSDDDDDDENVVLENRPWRLADNVRPWLLEFRPSVSLGGPRKRDPEDEMLKRVRDTDSETSSEFSCGRNTSPTKIPVPSPTVDKQVEHELSIKSLNKTQNRTKQVDKLCDPKERDVEQASSKSLNIGSDLSQRHENSWHLKINKTNEEQCMEHDVPDQIIKSMEKPQNVESSPVVSNLNVSQRHSARLRQNHSAEPRQNNSISETVIKPSNEEQRKITLTTQTRGKKNSSKIVFEESIQPVKGQSFNDIQDDCQNKTITNDESTHSLLDKIKPLDKTQSRSSIGTLAQPIRTVEGNEGTKNKVSKRKPRKPKSDQSEVIPVTTERPQRNRRPPPPKKVQQCFFTLPKSVAKNGIIIVSADKTNNTISNTRTSYSQLTESTVTQNVEPKKKGKKSKTNNPPPQKRNKRGQKASESQAEIENSQTEERNKKGQGSIDSQAEIDSSRTQKKNKKGKKSVENKVETDNKAEQSEKKGRSQRLKNKPDKSVCVDVVDQYGTQNAPVDEVAHMSQLYTGNDELPSCSYNNKNDFDDNGTNRDSGLESMTMRQNGSALTTLNPFSKTITKNKRGNVTKEVKNNHQNDFDGNGTNRDSSLESITTRQSGSALTTLNPLSKTITKKKRGNVAKEVKTKGMRALKRVFDSDADLCNLSNSLERIRGSLSAIEEGMSIDMTIDKNIVPIKFASNFSGSFKNSDSMEVVTSLRHPENLYTNGYLRLPPDGLKPLHASTQFSYVYFIIEGEAEVLCQNKAVALKAFGDFQVPAGIQYSIKNLSSEKPLIMSYVKVSV